MNGSASTFLNGDKRLFCNQTVPSSKPKYNTSSVLKTWLYSLAAVGLYGVASVTPLASTAAQAIEVSCTNEGGDCWIPSAQQNKITTFKYVASNQNNQNNSMAKYAFVKGVAGINCESKMFGDGAPNMYKKCSYFTHDPFGVQDYANASYQQLGAVNNWLTVPNNLPNGHSAYLLRYGSNNASKYAYQIAMPGERFYCNSDRFGIDPHPGQAKSCWATPFRVGDEDMALDSNFNTGSGGYEYGEYNTCANQGNWCDTGTTLPVLVRYANSNDSRFVTHVAQGGKLWCDSRYFDYDPDNKKQKRCEIRKLVPKFGAGAITGKWVEVNSQPANSQTRTHTVTITRGIVESETSATSEEYSNTIGWAIEASVGNDANYVSSTISIEQGYAYSEEFSQSFENSVELSQELSCQADPGVHLSVWYFEMSTTTNTCTSGAECDIDVNIGQYLCHDKLSEPNCSIGDWANCSGKQGKTK